MTKPAKEPQPFTQRLSSDPEWKRALKQLDAITPWPWMVYSKPDPRTGFNEELAIVSKPDSKLDDEGVIGCIVADGFLGPRRKANVEFLANAPWLLRALCFEAEATAEILRCTYEELAFEQKLRVQAERQNVKLRARVAELEAKAKAP